MLPTATTSPPPCRPLGRCVIAGGMFLFAVLGVAGRPAVSFADALAVACVEATQPVCKETSSGVFHWGVRTSAGGTLVRGMAQADAEGLRAEFLARTQHGGAALTGGSSTASFSDFAVEMTTPNSPLVELEFWFALHGAFSGSDYGPPCDHCGGQSPWVASGVASASARITGPNNPEQQVSFDVAWNSNDGETNDAGGVQHIRILVGSSQTFQMSMTMSVGTTAGNPSCLSGAGTCGIPGGAEVDGDFRNSFQIEDIRAYDAETDEEIFDFTVTGSNGIDYLAILRGCGNATLDDGEECDDGNVEPGDCCSQSCKLEPGACNDRDACTGDGVCDGSTCTGAERFSCPLPCGDADASGALGAVDALIALRTAVASSNCEECRCDANHDAGVTASDALSILRRVVGIEVMFDCPECLPDF
jgi:cysteine-rich repeat protein